jgi:hypothetical protein
MLWLVHEIQVETTISSNYVINIQWLYFKVNIRSWTSQLSTTSNQIQWKQVGKWKNWKNVQLIGDTGACHNALLVTIKWGLQLLVIVHPIQT